MQGSSFPSSEFGHLSIYRWVQRFTPLLIEAARPCRHVVGDRWFVDETYVKVAGVWRYVYRAVDQHGQVIDIYVSPRRDTAAARKFFEAALRVHGRPTEVVTDKAPTLIRVIDEVLATVQYRVSRRPSIRLTSVLSAELDRIDGDLTHSLRVDLGDF